MGVQAATGMPIAEVGFAQVGEPVELNRVTSPLPESHNDIIIIPPETPVSDAEDWNIPGSSKDPTVISPIQRSLTPTITKSPDHTPPKSPIIVHSLPTSQPLPQHQPPKKKVKRMEDYFLICEENARVDVRERERLYLELERERIRQRDIELRQRDTQLQLQAQWLEFMKEGLKILNNIASHLYPPKK